MTTAPKPFVFVLMPFAKEFDDLYNLGIRPACEEAGAYCERVSEQVYEGKIIDRIYNQIATADFIVAVMSGKNPNVFYEVGYAHALNKRVILVTNNVENIPFDLASYLHIEYSDRTELKQEVSKRLRFLITNPERASMYFKFPLRLLHSGKPLQGVSELRLVDRRPQQRTVVDAMNIRRVTNPDSGSFIFGIDLLNDIEKTIRPIDFKIGFVLEWKPRQLVAYRGIYDSKHKCEVLSLTQPDKRMFYLINVDFSLRPGCIDKLYINFGEVVIPPEVKKTVGLTVRVLTDVGTFDQDIKIILKHA